MPSSARSVSEPKKLAPLTGILAIVGLCLQCSVAGAVSIRDDTPDAQYRVGDAYFPALADLPIEGQGTLIASQWVVTAAYATAALADSDDIALIHLTQPV